MKRVLTGALLGPVATAFAVASTDGHLRRGPNALRPGDRERRAAGERPAAAARS